MRLKENVEKLSYGLKEVMEIEPISYTWKNTRDPDQTKLGLSAQQLLEIIPEVVKTYDFVYQDDEKTPIKKENENLGIYYSDLLPVLIKAIQEQQEIIQQQEKRLAVLEKANN